MNETTKPENDKTPEMKQVLRTFKVAIRMDDICQGCGRVVSSYALSPDLSAWRGDVAAAGWSGCCGAPLAFLARTLREDNAKTAPDPIYFGDDHGLAVPPKNDGPKWKAGSPGGLVSALAGVAKAASDAVGVAATLGANPPKETP